MASAAESRGTGLTGLAAATLGLALLALATPLSGTETPIVRVGWLLAVAAGIEGLHALRRSTAAARRHATVGAVISMAIALFLINAPFVAAKALRFLVGGWFAIDAVRGAISMRRRSDSSDRSFEVAVLAGNAAVALVLFLATGWLLTWVFAIAGALRIAGIAWSIMAAPVYTTADADDTVVSELGLADQPAAVEVAAEVEASEQQRAPIDRGWTLAFIVTLFAIHAGRMSVDATLLGLVSPAVAVLGDMLIAVLVTLVVINPTHLLWRGPTRWIERRVWRWHLRGGESAGTAVASTADGRVASLPDAAGHPAARGALLDSGGAQSRPADGPAVRRDHRGHRAGLGHELVLRHRELGGRRSGTPGRSRGPTPGARPWCARC